MSLVSKVSSALRSTATSYTSTAPRTTYSGSPVQIVGGTTRISTGIRPISAGQLAPAQPLYPTSPYPGTQVAPSPAAVPGVPGVPGVTTVPGAGAGGGSPDIPVPVPEVVSPEEALAMGTSIPWTKIALIGGVAVAAWWLFLRKKK